MTSKTRIYVMLLFCYLLQASLAQLAEVTEDQFKDLQKKNLDARSPLSNGGLWLSISIPVLSLPSGTNAVEAQRLRYEMDYQAFHKKEHTLKIQKKTIKEALQFQLNHVILGPLAPSSQGEAEVKETELVDDSSRVQLKEPQEQLEEDGDGKDSVTEHPVPQKVLEEAEELVRMKATSMSVEDSHYLLKVTSKEDIQLAPLKHTSENMKYFLTLYSKMEKDKTAGLKELHNVFQKAEKQTQQQGKLQFPIEHLVTYQHGRISIPAYQYQPSFLEEKWNALKKSNPQHVLPSVKECLQRAYNYIREKEFTRLLQSILPAGQFLTPLESIPASMHVENVHQDHKNPMNEPNENPPKLITRHKLEVVIEEKEESMEQTVYYSTPTPRSHRSSNHNQKKKNHERKVEEAPKNDERVVASDLDQNQEDREYETKESEIL